MLRIAVTLRSNFLHLVTLSQTAILTQRCYIMALRYSVTLHVCIQIHTYITRISLWYITISHFHYFVNATLLGTDIQGEMNEY